MKLILTSFFIYIFFFRLIPPVDAITYYVSPTGNDNNVGTTTSAPWRTIEKVNNMVFTSGDNILFEGEQIFSTTTGILFDQNDQGTPSSPIVVSSYGSGRATIQAAPGSNGIFGYNTGGFHITNINVTRNDPLGSNRGIYFRTDLPNNIKHQYIEIDNFEVSGFSSGIMLLGVNGTSGYKDVYIHHGIAHDNGYYGINMGGQLMYSHQNVHIHHVSAYNNFGDPSLTTSHTGDGIVIGQVDNGLIESSIAHDNGKYNANATAGPVGIWAWESNNIMIQYNESYNNDSSTGIDGGGFDFDSNVSNSVMQYNYSHDNAGAGFLLAQANSKAGFSWNNNVYRYNISENDARKSVHNGAIHIWNGGSGIRNAEIYNNVVFLSPPISGQPAAVKFQTGSTNLHFRNNIFITTGGTPLIRVAGVQNGLLFQGNSYWSSNSPFIIMWGGTNYTSLEAWRTGTGQEKIGTILTGLDIDPKLTNPGGGGTIGDITKRNTLHAYRLSIDSPLINAGLNLQTQFSINPGTQDYYGTVIPQDDIYDIGAHELTAENCGPKGDINCDGTININDLIKIFLNFGKTTTTLNDGDVSGDQKVNVIDAGAVLFNFN